MISTLAYNVCIIAADNEGNNIAPHTEAIIEYLTKTRNVILIPAAVRRASLCLIAARHSIADAGPLGIFPKEIVKMIAMEVWATRMDPIWIGTLSEFERTGKLSE